MKNNNMHKNKKDNALLCSIVASLLLNAFVFLITSFVIYKTDIVSNYNSYYIILSVFALSIAVSGYICASKKKKNGILWGFAGGFPSIVIIIFISLFSNGFKPDYNLLITAVILILSSLIGGILAVNINIRRKIRVGR